MCHLPVFYGKLLGMESHLTRQTALCFSAVKLGQYLGGCIVKSCHVTIVMGCSSSSTKSPSRSFSSRVLLYFHDCGRSGAMLSIWMGLKHGNHAVSSWAQPALTLISFLHSCCMWITVCIWVNILHLADSLPTTLQEIVLAAVVKDPDCVDPWYLEQWVFFRGTWVSSTWLQVLTGRARTSIILKPTSNWTFLQSWHFQMHDNPWSPQELVEETWRDAGTGLNIPDTVKKVERLGWRWDDCR